MTLPSPSVFAGLDVATLQGWLTQAQQAFVKLSMGQKAVEIVTQGDVVKYQRADIGDLRALISELQAAIAGRSTAGAIGVVWGT